MDLSHQQKTAVVLVNLGTPSAPTPQAIRSFLRRFLSDGRVVDLPKILWQPLLHGVILPKRPQKTAKLYQKIWSQDVGSPLAYYTKRQQELLQGYLGDDFVVYRAFSYSEPSIETTLRQIDAANLAKVVIIPLYPQYSTTTTASVSDCVMKFYHGKTRIPAIKFINAFPTQEAYIATLVKKIKAKWQTNHYNHLVLSYHGIPQKLVKAGDPYEGHCWQTTKAIVAQLATLPHFDYTHCYQSQFGPGKWLAPKVDECLVDLAHQNKKSVGGCS